MNIDAESLATLRTVMFLAAVESAAVQDAVQLLRDDDRVPKDAFAFQVLSQLSVSLRHCADDLHDLVWEAEGSTTDPTVSPPLPPTVACKALLENALSRLSIPALEIITSIDGDGMIALYGNDLGWSMGTILQWLVARAVRYQQTYNLRFTCRRVGDRIDISVQDQSERVPAPVLKRLLELGFTSVPVVSRVGERSPSPDRHD